MQQKNEITLERRNDITLVTVQGDITAQSEPYINDAYLNANAQGTIQKILIRLKITFHYSCLIFKKNV